MSSGALEIIDLTDAPLTSISIQETTSESLSVPPSTLGRRERRRLAAEARRNEPSSNNSSNSATIVISEDDEQRSAEKDADTSIKRKKRNRKRKDREKVLEDGEIDTREAQLRGESGIDAVTGLGVHNIPRTNGASNGRNSDTRAAANLRDKSRRKENMRRRSPSPPLFFIDDKPAEVPKPLGDKMIPEQPNNSSDTRENGLLLPDHVHLDAASAGIELDATILPDSEEEDDFIYFVDEDRIPSLRYYKEPKEKKERPDLVCGHCGREGHKTIDCRIVVCLLCGAKDEHQTRSCPISKTCFTCGMKGHVSRDCPDRHTSYRGGRNDLDCDRCGSHLHNSKECHTLWRIYEYLDDNGRKQILAARRDKRDLPIGEGGEGYVGEDLWCYNCGDAGHLGDDCRDQRPPDCPREPSAFGVYNSSVGPFADDYSPDASRRLTKSREWESDGNFDDGYGFAGPSDVGRRGRDKERERMRKQATEVDLIQDDDDWFGSRIRPKQFPERPRAERDNRKRDEKGRMDPPKKRTKIEISIRSQSSKVDLVSASDKLLTRISSPPRVNNKPRDDNRRNDRENIARRDKGRHRDRDRDRERRKERRPRDSNRDDGSRRTSGPSGLHWDKEGVARDSGKADQGQEGRPRQQYYGGYGR